MRISTIHLLTNIVLCTCVDREVVSWFWAQRHRYAWRTDNSRSTLLASGRRRLVCLSSNSSSPPRRRVRSFVDSPTRDYHYYARKCFRFRSISNSRKRRSSSVTMFVRVCVSVSVCMRLVFAFDEWYKCLCSIFFQNECTCVYVECKAA